MQVQSLTGQWRFRRSEEEPWNTGTVPGGIYTDLLENEAIPDPYDEDNELDIQWVGKSDWTYRRTFDVDQALLSHDRIQLHCDGLDTVTTVRVNGEVVGETENMHRVYEFDVTGELQEGENTIEVRFDSPVKYGINRADAYDYDVPALRYPVDQPARSHIRKAQCHYGWDWGPCLPTVGIYRDIRLVGFSGPRITHTRTKQEHFDQAVALGVSVGIESTATTDGTLSVSIAGTEVAESIAITSGEEEYEVTATVEDPDLWWPNGYGDQPLYDLEVAVETDETTHVETDRIGFREMSVVREPLNESDDGEGFRFEVNGTPVYAKGANWIPTDALYGRVTDERFEDLLGSAVDANMNMIRVWGGGYYEYERFYEVCDELGLLVWQDFMFACALYPSDERFLDSVENEVRDQIRRLGNHPSIALWCGNNEVEEGVKNWFAEHDHHEELADGFEQLFLDRIATVVEAEDPSRTYWPGSPSSGDEEPEPYRTDVGDIHYWDVWHKGAPFSEYEETEPRFVSEFGYQSFPSVELLRSVIPADQLNPTAPLMEHHQRNEGGNARILSRMADHFRVPFDFENFVYLSQVQQGMAMQTAIEHWRRLKPYCMGALYWQLNDLWPCASWSSIEYGGDWKVLQYVARRIFAPALVTTTETDEGLEIWIVSDETESIEGTLNVRWESLTGEVIETEQVSVSIDPQESTRVVTVDPETVIGERYAEAYLCADLESPVESYPSYDFFEPYKHLDLCQPSFDITVDGTTLTISADCMALFVQLTLPGTDGNFSDNYFHLPAGEERRITFDSNETITGDELKQALSIRHLRATY
ncbi:beta-mannosidase [Haloarcula mannanilytica]|uniref:Beta-mannosidase n=1 Tax=Haloarcula mannanilytica TaxID=2509225 RepID=A0A4C2EQG2_9EURY|nr:glycoside hydrolase family 2 protein [Haloarcula mannanilytica]GCF15957.1 beta-mannosidase [Haloarcula mannanilytica]